MKTKRLEVVSKTVSATLGGGQTVEINGHNHYFVDDGLEEDERILWAVAGELGFEPSEVLNITPEEDADCPYIST
jgi:hypothetical protein